MDQSPTHPTPLDGWPRAREWILHTEGGYVDDPHDPGGETNFGISRRSYPNVDVKGLTPDLAAAIYRRDFWAHTCADRLPPALGIAFFDSAVNQGKSRAGMLLQLSLGVHADGVVGAETIAAATKAERLGLLQGEITDYLSRRAVHYAELSDQRLEMRKFRRGWFRRLFELEAVCLQLLKPEEVDR